MESSRVPADFIRSKRRIEKLDSVFAALANRKRLDLLRSICDHPGITGAELADQHGWTRDTVSKLIKRLRDGELVVTRRDRQCLRIDPALGGVEAALDWMQGLRSEERTAACARTDIRIDVLCCKALQNAARRRLLTQLSNADSVKQAELARSADISQPETCRGLLLLVARGLVVSATDGQNTRYQLAAAEIEHLYLAILRIKTAVENSCRH